jgi:hypothetical protein
LWRSIWAISSCCHRRSAGGETASSFPGIFAGAAVASATWFEAVEGALEHDLD